jgi:hypothetical protein
MDTNGKRDRYVALSYFWEPALPGKPPIMLERSNKSNLEQRLPLSELPPTIRNVIDFTSRLRIPSIWIDRLCIIQDDIADWIRNAERMCDIYEGAFPTIAALGALTREDGFYLVLAT